MKNRGFTLIELVIAVAIVGILAMVAYPSYRSSVLKTHRSDAMQALMSGAQQIERLYTTNNCYGTIVSGTCTPNPAATSLWASANVTSGSVTYYTLSVASTNNTYTLTATPVGGQTADSCGTLTIDQAGNKTPATTGCW